MKRHIEHICMALVSAIVLFSCASQPRTDSAGTTSPKANRNRQELSISLKTATLGKTAKALCDQAGGNIVLMKGVEDWACPALKVKRMPYPQVIKQMAQSAACSVQQCSNYYFIYPSQYAALTRVSLDKASGPLAETHVEDISFGAGYSVLVVFKWMSQALGVSLVADNEIAEAECGEIKLTDVTLSETVEAVLKSARVVAFNFESKDEYLFVYSPRNRNPQSVLLNTRNITPEAAELLKRKVNVSLPETPPSKTEVVVSDEPMTLRDALPVLSKQLGVRVTTESIMRSLPVNPVTLSDISVLNAMNLIVRQWPVAEFGFEVGENLITIRRRHEDEHVAER